VQGRLFMSLSRLQPRRFHRVIAATVLLVLFACNLGHNYFHACGFYASSVTGSARYTPVRSSESDGKQQTSSSLQPCLVCCCQKHHFVIFSSLNPILDPLRTSHAATELELIQGLQPSISLDPSRAPPQIA
jgi:hypothetical protein